MKASRSVSNSPARFGGAKSLEANDIVLSSPGARSKRSRFRSPKKTPRKSLFNEEEKPAEKPVKTPYQLFNFESVLGLVDYTDDRKLFNDDDLAWVSKFRELDLNGRNLYVRLFKRKFVWRKVTEDKFLLRDFDAETLAKSLKDVEESGLLENGIYLIF